MKQAQKVIVGMSGGVDSSVAAYLLLKQGYQVEGLFMKNWEADDEDEYCTAAQDLADAQAVCTRLGIKCHAVNFSREYWDRVFQYFLDEYSAGRTPNPDLLCNKEIKFKVFLDYAMNLGADAIATGHYVRRAEDDGLFNLLKGYDPNKDQSYFLSSLNQHQVSHSLFPIGDLLKTKVRDIANELGFINHNKKDSTGICFIGERKFKDFLSEYLLAKPGEMITADGKSMGQHDGLMFYTLGQRQGLNIGGRKNSGDAPWYVLDKDIDNNRLIIGQGHNHPLLYAQGLQASQLTWIRESAPNFPLECRAKVRYHQIEQPCLVTVDANDTATVMFSDPQRAITPGQSVVFYQGDKCLGGGVIDSIIR